MKLKFATKIDAVNFYKENEGRDFTKGETIILYKAIVGHSPKSGKSKLDMINTIERSI